MQPVGWTAQSVAERLVQAFRLMPSHPVHSARGRFEAEDTGLRDALNWPRRFVSDPWARVVLLTWARCLATGASVREHYRELGWSRTKAERERRRALNQIVLQLNVGNPLTMEPTGPER